MPNPQSELRIFISSTFHDLQEEREYLVKKVFPEIRQLCRERGIEFTEIDLRWGLTEEEATQGKVIRTCLEEIDRCRPYFIGILGSRYGWVPKYSDIQRDGELLRKYPWVEDDVSEFKSLVEIEFDYGALRTPEAAEFAFFYSQREHVRSHRVFSEIAKDEKEKLGLLKSRIQNSGLPLREFSGPETLGEHIYNDLVSVIEKRWQKEEEMPPLERERLQHETFAASRRHAYISNPANTKVLNQAAESGKRLIVHAESGAGKSALLAHWAHHLTPTPLHKLMERGKGRGETFIIEHYIGIGSGADHIGLLTHIISEIKDHLKLEDEIPAEPEKIVSDFPLWLSRLTEERTVLVIDALNQLDEKSHHLGWLPEHLPENISIIASTTSDEMTAVLTSRGWDEMILKPLSLEEREALIVRYLSEYHKSLSAVQLKRIANDPKGISPLFLRTMLEELRIIGNFDKLDLIITHYISAKDTDDLFQKVLERMEEDYGSRTVRDVMSLLFASRKGLSEHELDDVIPISRAKLAAFLMALDYHLHRRDGLLTFFHDYLRRAVEARYAATDEKKKKLHEHIAEYMSKQPASARRADEEPWQWLQCEEWEKLRDSLVDLPLFEILAEKERQYELLGYWRELKGKYDVGIEYLKVVSSEENQKLPEKIMKESLLILSEFLTVSGLYTEAEIVLKKVFEIASKENMTRIQFAALQEQLGNIYYYKSEYIQAEKNFNEVSNIYMSEYGMVDKRTLESLNSHATILGLLGRRKEAIQLLDNYLTLYQTSYSEPGIILFSLLSNLAFFYQAEEQHEKAIELTKTSIAIIERDLGQNSIELINPLLTLGVSYRRINQHNLAKTTYDRAIAMSIKYLGSEHPLTARCRFSLAVLYFFENRFEESLQISREIIELYFRTLGVTHYETMFSLRFLFNTSNKSPLIKQTALELLQKALDYQNNIDEIPSEISQELQSMISQMHSI